MSLALFLYLITFILFLSIFASGMILGAVLAGMPTLYIMMGVLIFFVISLGIFRIVGRDDNSASSAD